MSYDSGITQREYDAVMAERDSALADLAALREENAWLAGQWHAAADGLAALRGRVVAAKTALLTALDDGGTWPDVDTALAILAPEGERE